MSPTLVKIIKYLQFLTPLRRYFFYRDMCEFSPAQLAYLCQCVDETRDVPGTILEIGCAMGSTAVFLNKHLDFIKLEKPYVCIDTFAGFTHTGLNSLPQASRLRRRRVGDRLDCQKRLTKNVNKT